MTTDSIEIRGKQIAGRLTHLAKIAGDDEQDTFLLRQMAQDAEYISSFSWCKEIQDGYFGGDVGGIFAVFVFHIRSGHADVDSSMWIVVGDVPRGLLHFCGVQWDKSFADF